MTRVAPLVVAALLIASPARAQWDFGGHFKYQFSLQHFEADDLGRLLVAANPVDHRVEGRADGTYRTRRIDLTAAGEFLLLTGDSVAASPEQGSSLDRFLLGLPDLADTHQWLDLGLSARVGGRAELSARFDRLSVGYTGDRFVARLGRQALSWGNGLVFQVLDLFNPFPPNVLDTDYKPGRDMFSAQWLLPAGDDVQAIAVPGRERRDKPLTADQSSVAAKWHHFAAGGELDVLAARHDGDTVVGAGISRGLAGGVWRADLSFVKLPDRHATSFLANYDRAWTPGGHTLYAFGEYFRNGFGVSDTSAIPVPLDTALLVRLERGEIFTLGRHELAGGVRFEWTPLVTVSPTVLVNLTDGSLYSLTQVQYDWRQNLVLFAGVQAGLGPRGTEYGGVAVAGFPGYFGPGVCAWARLARYF